jgi:hypothetical protein
MAGPPGYRTTVKCVPFVGLPADLDCFEVASPTIRDPRITAYSRWTTPFEPHAPLHCPTLKQPPAMIRSAALLAAPNRHGGARIR